MDSVLDSSLVSRLDNSLASGLDQGFSQDLAPQPNFVITMRERSSSSNSVLV